MQLQTMNTNRTSRRPTASMLSVALAAIILVGLTGLPVLGVHADSYNAVQITVSTSNTNLQYNYLLAAYNLTGSQVATYQSSYPAAAFELPAGSYLFTVSALREGYPSCPVCLVPEPAVGSGQSSGNAPDSSSSGSTTAEPVFLIQSASEYGYAVYTVNGPVSLTIDTQNITQYPTSPVNVKVTFANGTAAAGADVSASIVGQDYYWWGSNPSVQMSNQTNSLGIAHLVLPKAPAVVTAWDWLPVNMPKNNNTVPTIIGGQKINVTVYWEPTYVGLSASTMIIPPTSTVNLTLHYQQPEGWVTPLGVETAGATSSGASSGTIASQPTAVPSTVQSTPSNTGSQSQYYLPTAIPSIEGVSGTSGLTIASSNAVPLGTVAIGSAAVVLAAIGVALVVMRTRPHQQ